MDRETIFQTEWGTDSISSAGGIDNWEKTHFGYCLVQDNQIVAEAAVGPPALGLYEPGVSTREIYRGKGFGTAASARLIHEIEKTGGKTYWNCARQNKASAAIARKLGYQIEKEYRCLAWRQIKNE
jgi:RimJ/RimL family protein N-acetyltransferase